MYICLDCLTIFETPTKNIETHNLSYPPYETWIGCPKCAGTFVNAKECSKCEKYITTDYIELKDGDCICEDCFCHKNIEEIGCDFY